jgi:vancomycin resistance protein VanJ
LHLRAVLDVDGTQVVVYVAHPHTPQPRFSSALYDTLPRDTELSILLDRIRSETAPTMLLCDCNMSDQSTIYHTLSAELKDAFYEVGWGLGLTSSVNKAIPWMPLILRIDYVWYNNFLVAQNAFVWDDAGTSDHRPLIVQLQIKAADR